MAEYYLQEMNDLRSEGTRRAFYRLRTYRQATMDDVLAYMEKNGAMVHRGEAQLVLAEVQQALRHFLSLGYTVKIDPLGSFRLSLGPRPEQEVEPVAGDTPARNATSIGVRDVLFTADRSFVKVLDLETNLVRSKTHKLTPSPYTPAERLQRALEYIDQHGFMRIADYVRLTGLSRTSATTELQTLRRDETSGLTTAGRGTQKVYVRRK